MNKKNHLISYACKAGNFCAVIFLSIQWTDIFIIYNYTYIFFLHVQFNSMRAQAQFSGL